MRQSRRQIALGVSGLISVFILFAINIVQAQQPVFRIGVLDEQAGQISNGARLAVEEINAAGGAQGADGTFFQLELIVQPGTDLTDAVANLNQASVIAVLGPETTNEVVSNLAILQALNVPVLTPATGDTIIPSDTTGRIFLSRATDVYEARALANYVITDLGFQRIATIQTR